MHILLKRCRGKIGQGKRKESVQGTKSLFIDINNEIPREGESCPGNQRRQEKGLIFRD